MANAQNGEAALATVVAPSRSSDSLPDELAMLTGGRRAKYARVLLAALGSVPWVGGLFAAVAAASTEKAQDKVNDFYRQWLDEHARKFEELARALAGILERLEQLGPGVEERVQTDEYLSLVRRGFRTWDQAATSEKRKLVQDLLANAGGTQLTSDDVVRLFIEWIERYHEVHFSVIRTVYRKPGSTRGDMWDALSPVRPRDDSPEADLFRLLIDDLSRGRVIRQHRETTYDGQFLKKGRAPRGSGSATMKSAFDDEDGYELTELGKQFVHYTMNEIVPRIGG